MSGLRVAGYVGATVCLPLVALGLGVALTVDADDRGHLIVVSVAVAVVASLVAGASLLVAYRIAARTVDAMAERARAIAEGDPSGAVPIPVRGPREVTDLARAFNGMVDRVRRYMLDLERSQMEFRQSVRRLGDALVATHDPPGILGVAVDSARTVLGGRTAVAWLRNGDQLVPVASDGEVLAGRALAVGWGLAGEVAAAGRGRVDGMTSATAEPQRDTALAVPLHVNGEVFAVVAVYGRQAGRSRFSADDLDTLAALVQPAESAIENALLHDEATRLSVTDALTGLANRRELDRRFEAEVERHARFGEGFGLLLVDLDDFKEINDRFGHQAGDAVLVEVAGRVRGVTREVDVVARYGGEELAVLLPRADAAAAARTAERIRGAVADKPVRFGREARAVTCSVGVAALPQDAADLGALVAAADAALYRAKRAGKNRVERVA